MTLELMKPELKPELIKRLSESRYYYVFQQKKNKIPIEHKLRLFELLNEFRIKREFHLPLQYYEMSREEQKNFLHFLKKIGKDPSKIFTESYGFLIVLGWKKEFEENHILEPDPEQNLFKEKNISIYSDKAKDLVFTTRFFDNAILVDNYGNIVHSGIMLRNLDPLKMFEEMKIKYDHRSCHSRHMTAIAASYYLKNTTVFTLSEETNILRVYQDGKRIYSSDPKEKNH